VKQIVQISLGASRDDYDFEAEFMGQKFRIRRFGTDGQVPEASDLLLQWTRKADGIGLGHVRFTYRQDQKVMPDPEVAKLLLLGAKLQIPVTTGATLRSVSHEWSLRHTQFRFGNNYFDNARVFFFSGLASHSIARVMAEYTPNLSFADLVLDGGVPKFLNSLEELEFYASRIRRPLGWIPGRQWVASAKPARSLTDYRMRQAVQQAQILVVPHTDFYRYLDHYSIEELKGKIVITSTVYEDRIQYLKDKGVEVIIDTTPKILQQVVGVSVLEALLFVALNIAQDQGGEDDLLEIISDMQLEPRIIFPFGKLRRVNRFAFIVHPPSREFLKKLKPIEVISDLAPAMMGTVEKVMAYSPPFVYSTVRGIRSPMGVEAEGWLIALGATPEQMQAHDPDFTTQRILAAARIARSLGAQIMGIGLLPKAMKDSSQQVAKQAALPITTGNSYTASAALWASAEAVRRMGLTRLKGGKILRAKTMVIGATGPVGVICSRLLATAFEEVYLVGRNIAKLLTLQEAILKQAPHVKLHVSTRADTHLAQMDVVVAASHGAVHALDLMQVKPGCVVTDLNLPMLFSKEQTAKRPDVLVIRGGEILLPGENVEMEDIGLPAHVAYAGLAETITLALEGRFEVFSVGTSPQWNRVREIYRLGLKHGMKLASISGVNGIFSDEDIARVKELALRKQKKG
jgi:predicted amino acid dehydrogenase